ncbi:MAG: response regulator [Firmicutes bacterium]|nr:response regulator [Bacillota bacterium]
MYRLVIVDDEEIIREGLARIVALSGLDFEVVGEAENGKTGFELVCQLSPEIVIADVKMPVMNGLEMIDEIKQLKCDIRFIILSAYTDFNYTRHAIKSGVIDYLMKPVNRLELIALLKKIKEELDLEKVQSDERKCGDVPEGKIRTERNERKTIEIAKRYIQVRYFKDISLESVAKHVHMNSNYFSTLFKNETGENFIEYVTRVRIYNAKELLRDPNLKIYKVCTMVGYYSPKHFSKLFKNLVGVTPTQYREKIM